MTLHQGALFADRYQIESRLGRGGFASIFRANDEQREVEVALKVIHAYLADKDVDAEAAPIVLKVAEAASRLDNNQQRLERPEEVHRQIGDVEMSEGLPPANAQSAAG